MRNLLHLLLALLASLLGASPAWADLRAVYSDPARSSREEIIVEISDSGAVRVTSRDGSYLLILGDQAYTIFPGPGGPEVVTVEALGFRARDAIKSGRVSVAYAGGKRPMGYNYVAAEELAVGPRKGRAYRIDGIPNGAPVILSEDAELRSLGQALARYFKAVNQMQAEEIPDNLGELLPGKGVLGFWDNQLVSVEQVTIDPAHWTLPGTATTLADVRQQASEDTTEPAQQGPSIVAAAFFGKKLLTLDNSGAMASWSEGGSSGAPFATPGSVTRFCVSDNEVWLITSEGKSQGQVAVWSGQPESWRKVMALKQSSKEFLVTVDCSGSEPVALTTSSLRFLRSGKVVALTWPKRAPGGYPVSLQHGGYFYLGMNAGEWGGGLHRFALAGGDGKLVDAADPKSLCGGTLNAACDPVTGLAPDPARSDCVLATTGLVHFMANGSVLRICGDKIELAYAKPYTTDPNWKFDPAAPVQERFSSLPFFSMGSSVGLAWAVGSDGIYRFGSQAIPDFAAFGKAKRWPPSRIDWSDPEVVLILTDMNRRHSVSGNSLILVPR